MVRRTNSRGSPPHATALRNRDCRANVLLATPVALSLIAIALLIYSISLLAEIRHGLRTVIGAG